MSGTLPPEAKAMIRDKIAGLCGTSFELVLEQAASNERRCRGHVPFEPPRS